MNSCDEFEIVVIFNKKNELTVIDALTDDWTDFVDSDTVAVKEVAVPAADFAIG